jgi:hypothetical protein
MASVQSRGITEGSVCQRSPSFERECHLRWVSPDVAFQEPDREIYATGGLLNAYTIKSSGFSREKLKV